MSNGYITRYAYGQHNVVCATCQAYFKSREMVRQYNGLLTCQLCWDPEPVSEIRTPPTMDQEMRPAQQIQKDEDD